MSKSLHRINFGLDANKQEIAIKFIDYQSGIFQAVLFKENLQKQHMIQDSFIAEQPKPMSLVFQACLASLNIKS